MTFIMLKLHLLKGWKVLSDDDGNLSACDSDGCIVCTTDMRSDGGGDLSDGTFIHPTLVQTYIINQDTVMLSFF